MSQFGLGYQVSDLDGIPAATGLPLPSSGIDFSATINCIHSDPPQLQGACAVSSDMPTGEFARTLTGTFYWKVDEVQDAEAVVVGANHSMRVPGTQVSPGVWQFEVGHNEGEVLGPINGSATTPDGVVHDISDQLRGIFPTPSTFETPLGNRCEGQSPRPESEAPTLLGACAVSENTPTGDHERTLRTTYYWRVDEVIDSQTTVSGDVWQFTAQGTEGESGDWTYLVGHDPGEELSITGGTVTTPDGVVHDVTAQLRQIFPNPSTFETPQGNRCQGDAQTPTLQGACAVSENSPLGDFDRRVVVTTTPRRGTAAATDAT